MDADKLGNNDDIEAHWAIKAFLHAETYFKLLLTVEPFKIKLTPIDDVLYFSFRQEFPSLNILSLSEDLDFKSSQAKEKWRLFISRFEDQVSDFNFGTLIRTRSNEDYGPDNSFFVPRIQFVCIEIARNREGANISIYKNAALASAHKNDDADEEAKIMEQEMQILQEKIVGNLN